MSRVGEIQEAMTRLIMVQLGNERGEGGEDGSEEGDGSSMKGGGGVEEGKVTEIQTFPRFHWWNV